MSIKFDERNAIFQLDTPNTSYLFGLYSGSVLENIGLAIRNSGDFKSQMMIFEKL